MHVYFVHLFYFKGFDAYQPLMKFLTINLTMSVALHLDSPRSLGRL